MKNQQYTWRLTPLKITIRLSYKFLGYYSRYVLIYNVITAVHDKYHANSIRIKYVEKYLAPEDACIRISVNIVGLIEPVHTMENIDHINTQGIIQQLFFKIRWGVVKQGINKGVS